MIVLRHGQSEFNAVFSATRRDPGIPDPALTPLGHAQAQLAAAALAARPVRHVVVSPYRRAIATARPLAALIGARLEVTDAVREHFAFSCDIGSPRSVLERDFPDCDFSSLDEVWWPQAREDRAPVLARARRFRETMAARADQAETVVVCHWGFALALTGRALENGEWVAIDPDVEPAGIA